MDYLHLIITDIVFETSEPIALHFVDQDVTDDFVDFLAQSPTIGIHSFATDSPSWQSVIDYDSYFDKFKVYTDFEDFKKALENKC
jgi:hypothetical protein